MEIDEDVNDEDETKDLDTLVNSFNRLDNYIAKYIYQKYICSFLKKSRAKNDEESSFLEKQDLEKQDLEKQDLENPARKHDDKNINDEGGSSREPLVPSLDIFLKTIFSVERPCIITQKDSLETDLENMAIADEAYDKNPKTFKLRQYNSVPDIKRCSFIRKHKNKYKRCNNSIINDDSDTCYKHIESLNIYWDRYCEVMKEFENSIV